MRVTEMLGRRVRVYQAHGQTMFVEGDVVAVSEEPMVGVRDENGTIHWHVASLPIEVMTWEQISGRRLPKET